jgi:hypothetical protein
MNSAKGWLGPVAINRSSSASSLTAGPAGTEARSAGPVTGTSEKVTRVGQKPWPAYGDYRWTMECG